MKTALLRSGSSRGIFLMALFVAIALSAHGDQVDMQNGDHYSGKVVALDNNIVILKSDVLGTLRLNRSKVAAMTIGEPTKANPAPVATPAAPAVPKVPPVAQLASPAAGHPNPTIELDSSLSHQIATNPDVVNQVRSEVMATAGPKATQKFDALVDGLASGNLNVAGLRKEAAAVAAQLRQLRGSEDAEAGEIFDDYLAVLDSFLKETGGPIAPAKAPTEARPTTAKPLRPSAPAVPRKPNRSSELPAE